MNIDLLYKRILQSSFARDSFWAIWGNVIARGLSLLAGIAVANFLGKVEYGEYGLVRNTLLLISVLSTFGLGYTATKFVSEYHESSDKLKHLPALIREILLVTLVFSACISLFVFLFATNLAHFLEDDNVSDAIRLLSIVIITNALTTTQVGVLSGFKAFSTMSRINLISGLFNFVFIVVFAYLWGFIGSVWGLLCSQIINCVLNYRAISKFLERLSRDKGSKMLIPSMRKKLLSFSLPIALQELSYSLCNWGASVVALKMTDYGELGIYSVVTQWTSIILFIPGALRGLILSYMSGISDNERQKKLLKRMLLINFFTTSVPAFIVIILAEYIPHLYGTSFVVERMASVLVVGVVGAILQSLHNVFASDFLARSWNWPMYLIATVRDIWGLAICYILLLNTTTTGAMSLSISSASAALLAIGMSWGYLEIRLRK